jgi:hypothetical protein
MSARLRSHLLLLAAAAAAAAACGGNVIVDGAGGGTTGSSSSSSTTSAGATSSSSSSTTSAGATSSSSTGATSTSSSSASTSSSTGAVGACTQGADAKILDTTIILPQGFQCANQYLTNLASLETCLESATGLSAGCSACLAEDLICAQDDCLNVCINTPASPACTKCRDDSCAASFTACSGLPRETSATTCDGVYDSGPSGTPWVRGLPAADFTTSAAYAAYGTYDACACGSCAACTMDYCTGSLTASSACVSCITTTCASATANCMAN